MQKQKNFMLYASTSLRIFISPLSVLFSHFLPPSVSLSSLSLNSLPYLSSSADDFSLGLWRRLHLPLSDLHNCIDEQCLFNNVTGRFFYMTSQTPHVFQFQQKKDASTACIFIVYYIILCETDVYYDQLGQNVWYFNALLCCHLAEIFYIFLPWLMLYHNWISHHSTKFMVGSKCGRKNCIDRYDSFFWWRTSLDMMFELCI